MTVASFIASQRADHGVPHAVSCRALDVAESTFYKWHNRPPTRREQRRCELDAAVKASFDDSGGTPGTYGSPRVFEDLVEAGWAVSMKTVAASMARQGLQGRPPKRKRRGLTRPDKAAAPIPDLVKRDFTAERIDQRWCGDLTEIPTGEGKLYLSIVEDLASRRVPGFAMSDHHDGPVAKAALCMAAAVRGGDVTGVVFHSDKGDEGGFKWWSQHPAMGAFGGCWEAAAGDPRVARSDSVAGSAVECASRESRPVLGGDRSWGLDGGRGRRGGCGIRGWGQVVPSGWRDADTHFGPAVGPLFVVR
jgi:hypothetical protein